MMQQPGYAQQMPPQIMQGSPPQGYAIKQQPGNWQPAQNQPAMQAARGYVSNDRLPAMPDMMRRPAATNAPAENRQPIVRGAAPEQASAPPANHPPPASSPGWTPIRIPTPIELGILTSQTKETPVSTVALPERYDLGTVSSWLDRQGARSCLREKLPEGIQFVCNMGANTPTITVRGVTEEAALQKLVQEVVKSKQELTLSHR